MQRQVKNKAEDIFDQNLISLHLTKKDTTVNGKWRALKKPTVATVMSD